MDFLKSETPDILGIQETKIQSDQIPAEAHSLFGYQSVWHCGERKGYSGTSVFFKTPPINIITKFESPVLSLEGRMIQLDYEPFSLFNVYFPNGQMSEERLQFKLKFYDECLMYFDHLRKQGKRIIIMGDFNTAHQEIDLKHPKSNEDRSGFLPIERAWIDRLINHGYIDTFRLFCTLPDQYTWWTYRFNARKNNVGWRIDYIFTSPDLKDQIQDAYIMPQVFGSDHCPIGIKILL